jgi:Glycosyl transferase family 2
VSGGGRPTLTVAITARDAGARLASLLAEAQGYADEIVVGVDVASVDDTWAVACASADRAYRFAHAHGVTSPARMAGLERASGDWILFLDDDEGMDAAFPTLRDELLGTPDVSHWWLPRRWLDGAGDPPAFLAADPWWPDFSLRLARADRSRIWKPIAVHSGLRVVGRAGRETRTAILHYERADRDRAARDAKLAAYRGRGQAVAVDGFYADDPATPRRPVDPPPLRDPRAVPEPRAARVDAEVDDLDRRPIVPGWAAEVEVDMPATAAPGAPLVATARARNTGTLRWDSPTPFEWPGLGLSYRVTTAGGTLEPDLAPRTLLGRGVPPGGAVELLCTARAPAAPGVYVFAWQLISEHEFWFEDLGSPPARCTLTVRAAA